MVASLRHELPSPPSRGNSASGPGASVVISSRIETPAEGSDLPCFVDHVGFCFWPGCESTSMRMFDAPFCVRKKKKETTAVC